MCLSQVYVVAWLKAAFFLYMAPKQVLVFIISVTAHTRTADKKVPLIHSFWHQFHISFQTLYMGY